MTATLIDGKAIAARIRDEVAAEVDALRAAGRPPVLCAVAVGDNPASEVYLRNQKRGCEKAGIEFRLHRLDGDTPEDEVARFVAARGSDAAVTGIILQLPLPKGVDARRVQAAIPPEKDVEGVHPANLGMVTYAGGGLHPCTALSALECIRSTGVAFRGAEAVVVGHSNIVGKPTALLLLDQLATVTVCHIGTRDLAAHTRRADLLVVAVGKPGLVRGDMVKPGAVVIDIGINEIPDGAGGTRIVGDCDFDSVAKVAGHLTPVPGGAGPVTVAMLLRNTVTAGNRRQGG